MKKIIILLLLLYFNYANAVQIIVVPVQSTLGETPPTYDLTEGFEGAGFETPSVIISGGYDADYTSIVLTGIESLFLWTNGSNSSYVKIPIVTSAEVWFYYKLRFITMPETGNLTILLLQNNSTTLSQLQYYNTYPDKLYGLHGTTSQLGSYGITIGITYFIWGHYKNDGNLQIAISDSCTKPANNINITTGTSTNSINYITFYLPTGVTAEQVIDSLKVSYGGEIESCP